MPETEQKTTTLPPAPPPSSNHRGESGVVHVMSESTIPKEFLSVARDVNEALANTFLTDNNERNNIIRLHHLIERYHITQGEKDLLKLLNSNKSVGGKGWMYALFSHVGIVAENAVLKVLGYNPSKSDVESLRKAQEMREKRNRNNDENDR